jgi:two-component system CheB/CheR fusion protein
VTERNADADQLRKADQRKNEFLAMLAHELRNPLTPITHAIRLLRETPPGTPVGGLYDMLERQTRRLTRLVDDLLDIARISRGHIDLRRESVDLRTLAQQAAEAARPRLEERKHELSTALPESAVPIEGDPVRLEQIVANLLENAAKYTQPGGTIQIKLAREGDEALLSVRDNGIGLAPENLEAIFGLFTQVDSSLARSGGGLGIGLTLVRRVLELHDGRIEARSAGLGHGTEFIVHLPIAKPKDHELQVKALATATPAATRRRRVLIVDDNSDAAETLALLATHWGHEVAVANDGPSALEVAQRFQPEHALVDIGLPGMSGYELGRQLREQQHALYLVALTGYGREEDRKEAYAAGFDAHLVKPADLEELQEVLANGGAAKPR